MNAPLYITLLLAILLIIAYVIPRFKKIITNNTELFSYIGSLIGTFLGVSLATTFGNYNQEKQELANYEIILNNCINDLTGNHNSLHNLYRITEIKYSFDTTKISNLKEPEINTSSIFSIKLLLTNNELFQKLSSPVTKVLSPLYSDIQFLNKYVHKETKIDKRYIKTIRNGMNKISLLIEIIKIEKNNLKIENRNEICEKQINEAYKKLNSSVFKTNRRKYLDSNFKIKFLKVKWEN